MKKIIYLTLFSFLNILCFGQETLTSENPEKQSIDAQFEELYKKSGNYQEYEVAKKVWLLELQKNINDSLQSLKSQLVQLQAEVNSQQTVMASLQSENSSLKDTLSEQQKAQNSIGWLGFIDMHKNYYRILMWSLLIVVTAMLLFFYRKFKNADVHTKRAQNALKELEAEYETHRQRAMEREQKAMRRLQDEINKNKYASASKK